MLIYSKIFIFTNKPKSKLRSKNWISLDYSFKKEKKISLNKSHHVYKKAKEHFVFSWPIKGVYITPVFIDNKSHEFFLSNLVKFFSLYYPSSAFYIKKIIYSLMFQNYKYISCGKKAISGRCNGGTTTLWHRGGGHKINYKFVDFFRKPNLFVYKVCGYEYDANRSSFVVMLVSKFIKKHIYTRIIYPKGLTFNSIVKNCKKNALSYNFGDSFFIQDIPVGAFVHNVERTAGLGGKFIRAPGSFGQIIQKNANNVLVKMPSGKVIFFNYNIRCTFGVVGNENFKLVVIGKAGRMRWLGYKPIVRGVAMNPIDHPHGGGEGKSQIGKHPVTPWGKLTKGKKTR